MEFDDGIKKIWDTQNNQPMYAIDEQTLHRRILAKKSKTIRITNLSELALILANVGSGLGVLASNLTNEKPSISLFLMAGLMMAAGGFTTFNRFKRLHAGKHYDETVLGGLKHSIFVATYQVRLSLIGRWSVVLIALLSVGAMLEGGKPTWLIIALLVLFIAVHFASGWEHRIYVAKKAELEGLLKKLAE